MYFQNLCSITDWNTHYGLTELHQKRLSTTNLEQIHQFDLQITVQQKKISEL